MKESQRLGSAVVKENASRPNLRERMKEKVDFLKTAFGGVPREAWPEDKGPWLGNVPDHPNV